jgi:outer membrane protein OmpA-like peptidoglycan-associated protein
MKQIILIVTVSFLITGLFACSSSKNAATGPYVNSFYKKLKRELPDAKISKSGDTVRVIYPELAMFDFGKDEIKQEALPSFRRFASVLQKYDRISFIINGHTDSIGSDNVNEPLSESRAENTRQLMAGNGISDGRMRTQGMGAVQPLESNATRDGRQANRRVEFLLYDIRRN